MESVGPDLHLIYDQGDWLYPPAHPDPHSMTSPESVPSTGLLSVDKDKERSEREAREVAKKSSGWTGSVRGPSRIGAYKKIGEEDADPSSLSEM